MDPVHIRTIQAADNAILAIIIRDSLAEFGLDKPGTTYFDASTDRMFDHFQDPGSAYFVSLQNGEIVGGGGIFPSPGLPPGTCELVKMYLAGRVRGKGIGKQLIRECLDFAQRSGYRQVYIETFPELKQAMAVYERFGFYYLDKPMGNTGHYSCTVWMLKEL